jgi:hypothetical protein
MNFVTKILRLIKLGIENNIFLPLFIFILIQIDYDGSHK